MLPQTFEPTADEPTFEPTTAKDEPTFAPTTARDDEPTFEPTTAKDHEPITTTTPEPAADEPTFEPTTAKDETIATTPAPTTPAAGGPCSSSSQTLVELRFRTDYYGHETSWELRNVINHQILDGGSGYLSDTEYKFDNCINPDLCYELTIWDSFGDGLHSNGFIELTVGGEIQAYLDDQELLFGSMVQFQIGSACDFINLIPQPTASPTPYSYPSYGYPTPTNNNNYPTPTFESILDSLSSYDYPSFDDDNHSSSSSSSSEGEILSILGVAICLWGLFLFIYRIIWKKEHTRAQSSTSNRPTQSSSTTNPPRQQQGHNHNNSRPPTSVATNGGGRRQQQRHQQSRTTTTRTRTQRNTTNTNDSNTTSSLRMKILNILIPRQQSIRKDQMMYDSEEQSYRYVAGGGGKGTTSSCGICLEYFAEGDVLMMGLCQHVYHRKCCMDWVVKQNSCPLCRKKMFDENTYKMIKETITT